MLIQVISLSIKDANHGKFYNAQDVGLGRALNGLGHEVELYCFIKGGADKTEKLAPGLTAHFLASRCLGVHSLHSCNFITDKTDLVICFSDNQINFRRVLKRCKRHHAVCLPYVGVIGSRNANPFKQKVADALISNIRYYKKMKTFAKTPHVKAQLENVGAADVEVAPCCLDLTAVRKDFDSVPKGKLREEAGFKEEDRVLLFLARMTPEKHPVEMAELFAKLHGTNASLRLAVIGKGELEEEFEQKLKTLGVREAVLWKKSVPNDEVWKYYRMADAMINLNRGEIFGMAILEAMYYGCPVVARRAPGPEYMLQDKKTGFLCDDSEQVLAAAEELIGDGVYHDKIAAAAAERVRSGFLWESSAGRMLAAAERLREGMG